jgi:hypothetical protein
MIWRCCGVVLAGRTVLAGRPSRRIDSRQQHGNPAGASDAWWDGGRPEGWSLEQSLEDLSAGRDGNEAQRALAEAVAHWVRQSC